MYWPTRNTFHPMDNSPYVFSFLQGLGETARRQEPHRRLFVGRRDATTRQLLNDDDVFARLEAHGFERVVPGTMSFSEQVQTFAEANVVVGVCGAALTNLVFMPAGAKVIMLTPATMAGWFFWDITSHCGHDFVVVWGGKSDRHGPDITLDFSVDVDAVLAALT